MYSLCLRRVTDLLPQTSDLLLYFLFFLKLLRRSTGDPLASLADSWLSSLSCFGETYACALDILKAFERVSHKFLLSKLPSFGFYPSFCTFTSSFLSGRSISAVEDGDYSKLKPINSSVLQGSVLFPTIFMLFIN